MKSRTANLFLIIAITFILQACGSAHIKPEITSKDISEFSYGFVSSVNVSSKETNGDSLAMNKKMLAYANDQLTRLIETKGLELRNTTGDKTLSFKLNVDIVYGSRAARYFVGFGAGKGTVRSTLEVFDSQTNELKFSASGASDLAMGGFGGSMENVISKNIDYILKNFHTTYSQ